MHGTEFVEDERAPPFAHPHLLEQNGARRVQFDGYGYGYKQGKEEDRTHQGDGEVEGPLQSQIPPADGDLSDTEHRNAAQVVNVHVAEGELE